jgi:hypothetical protein
MFKADGILICPHCHVAEFEDNYRAIERFSHDGVKVRHDLHGAMASTHSMCVAGCESLKSKVALHLSTL